MNICGVYGSKKTNREHVLVRLSIDGKDLDERMIRDHGGTILYASNPAFRGSEHWWAFSVNLHEGSIICLETKVGVYRKGQDTDRTVTHYYEVSPEANILEVMISRVGPKKYPLLKGRLIRVSQSTKQDQIDQKISGMFDDVDES